MFRILVYNTGLVLVLDATYPEGTKSPCASGAPKGALV